MDMITKHTLIGWVRACVCVAMCAVQLHEIQQLSGAHTTRIV